MKQLSVIWFMLALLSMLAAASICYADDEYGVPSAPSVYVGDGKVIINAPGMPQQPASPAVIFNNLSGKCIDVAGAPGQHNGAKLQLWDCELSGRNLDNNSITDQQWKMTKDGFIVNVLSGKCIDVAGAPGHNNGSQLQLWDCEFSGRNPDNNSTTDQQWKMTRDGFIVNVLSGKCIDVAGAPGRNNGSQLQLWDCERSGRNPDNNSITDHKWSWK